MKNSHIEALRVRAQQDQAETMAKLEESVRVLTGKVDDLLATVTEIRENLSGKPIGKVKEKPQKDAAASE